MSVVENTASICVDVVRFTRTRKRISGCGVDCGLDIEVSAGSGYVDSARVR